MSGCNGQKKQNEISSKPGIADSTVNPKVDVKVNKKFDEKGNLVQYDSTYSYFYSSPGFEKNGMSSDGVIDDLEMRLHHDFKGLLDDNLTSGILTDSLLKDFYNDDYFSKRFKFNRERLDNALRQMESIKSDLLKQPDPRGENKNKK